MKETRFIEQNKHKWDEFEMLLSMSDVHPDELQKMYILITDDLSFYPNRSVRVYLNFLAQKIFSRLYKTKKSPMKQFVDYWRYSLPQLVWEARWEFVTAFSVFMIAVLIGVISTMIDADFPRTILGDAYVDETIKNINNHDPAAIYKGGSAIGGTLGITANNIFVALRAFVTGIFAGIGTIVVLLQNGIMLGAFQYFFIARGVGFESMLAIWLHGTFEISAIVIAGAAGLTLGKGILFPGTYTRMQSFQRGARRGFEIVTGILPLFIVAGIVEGCFTRFTDAPTVIRLGFILLCAAFVLFYFVLYPYYLHKKGYKTLMEDSIIPPDDMSDVPLKRIRSSSEIFSDSFAIFRKMLGGIFTFASVFSIGYLFLFFYLSKESPNETVSFEQNIYEESIVSIWQLFYRIVFSSLDFILLYFNNENVPFLWLLNSSVLSLFATIIIIKVKRNEDENYGISFPQLMLTILLLFPASLVLHFILMIPYGFLVFLALFVGLSFLTVWLWSSTETKNPFTALGNTFSNVFNQFGFNLGASIFLLAIGMVLYVMSCSFVMSIVMDFFTMQVYADSETYHNIEVFIKSFVVIFSVLTIYAFFIIGGGLIFNAIREMEHAEGLLERIKSIKAKRSVRGLEVE
jgi:uncharacterized membrane protein SpoIIM required for sporulation